MEIKTIDQKIEINAPADKVWKVLWNRDSYEEWTSAYSQGSHYTGEIEAGNVIQFLSADKTGMQSKVIRKVDNREMVFEHTHEILNGELGNKLGNLEESYLLGENEGKTTLHIKSDMPTEYFTAIDEATKDALKIIKDLSEK